MKNVAIGVGFAIIAFIGLACVASIGWYLTSPLFIDDVVDEDFPVEAPAKAAQLPAEAAEQTDVEISSAQTAEQSGSETAVASESEPAEVEAAAADMSDKEMDEPMPQTATTPIVVLSGQFQDADTVHQGSGSTTIYQLPEGEHILRFEDFEATNGPDLHVLLSKNPAPSSRDEVMEGYLDLGSLKGNIGNQNYKIPAGADISEYKSVVIYCMPFHVVFAIARLG